MDYQNLSDGEIMFNRMTERYRRIREQDAERERRRNARERLNRLRDIRSGQIIETPRLNYIETREDFIPNLDQPTGPFSRIARYINSGVVLHESPFDLKYLSMDVLCNSNDKDILVQTICYKLK